MSRYITPSPFWRRLSWDYWRGLRLAKKFSRTLATDPQHTARVREAIRRHSLRTEEGPRDLLSMFNDLRVKYGLRDVNPFPVIRFVRWLP